MEDEAQVDAWRQKLADLALQLQEVEKRKLDAKHDEHARRALYRQLDGVREALTHAQEAAASGEAIGECIGRW
jgi:hypothetical protein